MTVGPQLTLLRYLEITFRGGKPFAAYLYLPRKDGDQAQGTRELAPGIIADFAADGRPIGLEFLSPASVTAQAVNAALRQLGLPPGSAC
ncbi:MAG: DUF2283 domain-containing protein [Phycisphaerales bacterium]|nr:DUF2283 domain-containing protein [Phycisphaerales bacterium]